MQEEIEMAFKIIVCAKQVPDTNVIKINPKTGTLIRDGVPSILNHDDANALEEALKIKDKYEDVTITVVSMGPPQASDLLFECIAKGADEGILVSDRAVGGSDTWATSNTLEAAIKKWEKENGPADLISQVVRLSTEIPLRLDLRLLRNWISHRLHTLKNSA
jgi:electron transfer flavoprotein beta subunit